MKTSLFIFILCGACAPMGSPRYNIHVEGNNPQYVDTAWEIAASLVNLNPTTLSNNQWIVVVETNEPITMSNSTQKYSGLTTDTYSQVYVVGCALSHTTPMVHELLHQIKYITTKDNDSNHTDPAWKHADGDFGNCN